VAVDRELAATDTVGIAAGRRAEIRGVLVVLELVEAENEWRLVAVEAQILNDCAPRDDLRGQSALGYGDTLDLFSGCCETEIFPCRHIAHSCSPRL